MKLEPRKLESKPHDISISVAVVTTVPPTKCCIFLGTHHTIDRFYEK